MKTIGYVLVKPDDKVTLSRIWDTKEELESILDRLNENLPGEKYIIAKIVK